MIIFILCLIHFNSFHLNKVEADSVVIDFQTELDGHLTDDPINSKGNKSN